MAKYIAQALVSMVAVSLLFLLSGCDESPPQQPQSKLVKAVTIKSYQAFEQRHFTGKVQGTNEINLMFRLAGPLVTLPVRVGDEVVAGDVLAQVDPREFEIKIAQLEAQLTTARAGHVLAEKEFLRAKTIHGNGMQAISDADLDHKQAALDTTLGQVKSLEAGLEHAIDALSYTQLKAPFGGKVVARYVDNFEHVSPQQPIVKIVSLNKLEVIIDVPESLIMHAEQVQDIQVTLPNLAGLTLEGKLARIGSEASFRTRTYPVTINIVKPANVTILAGMTVSVSGKLPRVHDVQKPQFELPLAAVFHREDRSYVWRVNADSDLEQVIVGDEQLVKNATLVTGDLHDGDVIVIAGTKFLNHGDAVEVLAANKLMR